MINEMNHPLSVSLQSLYCLFLSSSSSSLVFYDDSTTFIHFAANQRGLRLDGPKDHNGTVSRNIT
jgi:hypothetical protein